MDSSDINDKNYSSNSYPLWITESEGQESPSVCKYNTDGNKIEMLLNVPELDSIIVNTNSEEAIEIVNKC